MSLLTKERPGMVMQLIYLKICLVFHFFRRLNRYRWQRLHEQDKAHRLLRDFSIPSQTHLSSRALAQLCRRFSHWLTLQLQLVSGGCRWISLRKQPRLSSLLTTRYTSRGVRRRGGGGICGGQRVRPQVNFALYSLSSATEFLYWWLKSMENSKSRHSTKRRGRVRKMVVYERIQSENFDWENSKDLSGSLIWVISFRCWSYTWRFDWALIPRMFVSLSYNTKWVNRHHHQFVNKKEHWAQNWALGKTSWTFQKVWLRPVNPETNRFRLPWIP